MALKKRKKMPIKKFLFVIVEENLRAIVVCGNIKKSVF